MHDKNLAQHEIDTLRNVCDELYNNAGYLLAEIELFEEDVFLEMQRRGFGVDWQLVHRVVAEKLNYDYDTDD